MLQRLRRVVPLGNVAHHRGRILHAVDPTHLAAAVRGVQTISENQKNRNVVAEGVINSHRCMLAPHRAMGGGQRRLALDLGVAVGHGHRGLFVHAGDVLRRFIAAVVEDRLVDLRETRARHGDQVLEAQRLENVHHEIGAGLGVVLRLDPSGRSGIRRDALLGHRDGRFRNQRRRARGRAFQEAAPIDRIFLGLRHDETSLRRLYLEGPSEVNRYRGPGLPGRDKTGGRRRGEALAQSG